jgi:hypothetical protein
MEPLTLAAGKDHGEDSHGSSARDALVLSMQLQDTGHHNNLPESCQWS